MSGNESIFVFDQTEERLSELDQYKRLINAEVIKQGVPLAHLADRLGVSRTRMHKIIRQTNILSDDLRDRIFEALGIDPVRAKVCVALLRDHRAYYDPNIYLVTEGLKGFYCEVISRRRGEIHVDLRPAIIHAALAKAYDALLSHQDRVIEHEQNLQV